jgi:hypothetical protein
MQQGVFVDLVRTLRLPISTHVWRDGVEPALASAGS